MNGLRFDSEGLVVFIGAGSGTDDLITVQGACIITEADIVIQTPSLVHPGIVAGHKPGAEVIDSAPIPLEDLVPLYARARDKKLLVARVHTGGPDIYGATAEQCDLCVQIGTPIEAIPGILAFSATTAWVDSELTLPEVTQSMILAHLEDSRTPMPEKETISSFVARGTTASIYLSATHNRQPEAALPEGGRPPETPCVISCRVTWPDEAIWWAQLRDLSVTMKEHKLWKHTIMLVGSAPTTDRVAKRSRLYHSGFQHECRDVDRAAAADLREYGVTTYNLENGDNT